MNILAIDPGPTESAWLMYDCRDRVPVSGQYGIEPNQTLLCEVIPLTLPHVGAVAIEQIGHYGTGMPAGREVFDTCIWIGRFVQRIADLNDRFPYPSLIQRQTIKTCICGTSKAKDAHVRQAVIDRFGGKDRAIGRKAAPGPLYGFKTHLWQVMGLAECWADTTVGRRK